MAFSAIASLTFQRGKWNTGTDLAALGMIVGMLVSAAVTLIDSRSPPYLVQLIRRFASYKKPYRNVALKNRVYQRNGRVES
jgi:hypothetical protein